MFSTGAEFGWLEQPSPRQALGTFLATILPNKTTVAGALLTLLLIAAGGAVALRRKVDLTLVIGFHLVLFPLIIWGFGYAYKPIYMERVILPAMFGAALSIGALAAYARPRFLAIGISAIALSISLVSSLSYLTRDHTSGHLGGQTAQNWRAAIQEGETGTGSALFLCSLFSYPTARYYAGEETDIWVLQPYGTAAPITDEIWMKFYGVPASERMDGTGFDRSVLENYGTKYIPVTEASQAYATASIAANELFCAKTVPDAAAEGLGAGGFSASAVRSYGGVFARSFTRNPD